LEAVIKSITMHGNMNVTSIIWYFLVVIPFPYLEISFTCVDNLAIYTYQLLVKVF
jgi:hypothetical protein